MGLKLSSTLRKHPLGLAVCVGLLACVLTWRKIAP
jgi:chromate transporter